jgi:hypothetical protein
MRTQPRRSRIAHFKAPFLASVAGATVATLACGARIDDTSDGVGDTTQDSANAGTGGAGQHTSGYDPNGVSNGGSAGTAGYGNCPIGSFCNPPGYPPSYFCPSEMPVAGSACYDTGQTCSFPGCEGPESSTASCIGGQWLVQYSFGPACNPPAVIPVCPERALPIGEACAYDGQVCLGECDSLQRSGGSCSGGTWQAVIEPCGFHDAGVAASVDAGSAPDAGP